MIEYHEMTDGDACEAFVYNAWIRSYLAAAQGGDDKAPPVELAQCLARASNGSGDAAVRSWIQLLRKRGCRVWVAHPQGEPGLYLGFVAGRRFALDYLYVKRVMRRQGVGAALLHHAREALGFQDASSATWPWVVQWFEDQGIGYNPRT